MSSSQLTQAINHNNIQPDGASQQSQPINKPLPSASTSFRCYLRQPDMRSIIYNIFPQQSITQIKQKVKQLFNLNHVNDLDSIKLVVNQVQLVQGVDLNQHLFNNAIVHVVVVVSRSQQQQQQQQQQSQARTKLLTLRVKQPPVNCPIYTIQNISPSQSVKTLKSTILSYYQSQHPENNISQLNQNQLYLVYGGRVLMDSKCLHQYGVVDQTGVVYVVNGRVYVKEVTKEEAERRINQVKRGNYSLSKQVKQQQQQNKQQQLDSEIHPQQANDTIVEQEFNIIQNIVHDSDSQVQGQTADDLARSQKFIQRYNSITQNDDGEQQQSELKGQQVQRQYIQQQSQQPLKETQQQPIQYQQANNSSQNTIPIGSGNQYKTIDMVINQDKDNQSNQYQQLSWQSRMQVGKYLDYVNHQVADYQATREVFYCNQGQLNNDANVNVNDGGQRQQQQQQEGQQQQQKQQQVLTTTQTTPLPQSGDQLNNNDTGNNNNNNDEMLI